MLSALSVALFLIFYASFSNFNSSADETTQPWLNVSASPSPVVVEIGKDFDIHTYAELATEGGAVNVSLNVGFVVTWNWANGSEELGTLCHGIYKGMRYVTLHSDLTGESVLEGLFQYTDQTTGQTYFNKTIVLVTVV